MKNVHALYEILKFPLGVLFVGMILLGAGNLFTNTSIGIVYMIENEYIRMFAEICYRTGQFLVINFPFIFLIRLVSRRGGSSTTVISAIAGYAVFLVSTIFTAPTDLSSGAYSSILGLSISKSTLSALSGTTRYPLQAGIFATIIVAIITLLCFQNTRNKDEYGLLSFISKETSCTIRTIIFCMLAGIAFGFIWPYAIAAINEVIRFISVDTTNPVNLALYGIMDRILGVLNLGTLIRQPFWYASQGGSWVSMSGTSITGDVSVWTQQAAAGAITGMAGRFITPYYILNIFAMPAVMSAFVSLQTSYLEKRKARMLCLAGVVVSMLSGNLLVMELMMLLLCPLLFGIHLAYTGILFALLQGMHIYLGFNSTDSTTLTALPGTLPELLTYIKTPSLQRTLLIMVLIGIITAVIYFITTRVYFKYLALDLFRTGEKQRMVEGTIKALGGIENIKMTESTISALIISVYDPSRIDPNRLKRLGAFRIFETKAGFNICYGASSTMVRIGIDNARRSSIRAANLD